MLLLSTSVIPGYGCINGGGGGGGTEQVVAKLERLAFASSETAMPFSLIILLLSFKFVSSLAFGRCAADAATRMDEFGFAASIAVADLADLDVDCDDGGGGGGGGSSDDDDDDADNSADDDDSPDDCCD